MRIILYAYAAIYALFSISVIVDDVRDKHPIWRTATDGALVLIASLGMLFYFLDMKNHSLVLAWRVISVFLLAGQMFMNFYERNLIMSGKDPAIEKGRLSRRAVWATDLVTMIIVLPAIVINLIYAYF